MKYLGCVYYPEYWGRERVEIDAELMQAAGVNVVRVGEFAWCRMEPKDGVFTLDWLHECVQTLGRYGINVILCTPTATPPAWLTSSNPETCLVQANGSRMEHGARRHYCYSSETYARYTARIVEKLAVEFCKYANVVGWQVDNEPDLGETGGCYCECCQTKFRQWLQNRYGTIEMLNKQWATGFWSMDYTEWEQVRLAQTDGKHSSSRVLDTRRFFSDALSGFIVWQGQIIKSHAPSAVVSTNVNGSIFTALDYNKIFSSMDITMKDLYFDICTMERNVLILDQFRSYRPERKFWITETGAGMCGEGKPSTEDQFKAWMWSSYAHGADAYVVFRWRTCLSGQEQEIEGMLEHSGHPGPRYQKVKAAFHQMCDITAGLGELPPMQVCIAIVHDYDVMWGYQSCSNKNGIDYVNNLAGLYRELYKRQLAADIIPASAPMEKYSLVILPSLFMIDQDFAERLKAYVENGGTVLAQGQTGMRDRNCNYLAEQGPCWLQDLLGVKINGGMYLYSAVEVTESWTNTSRFSMELAGLLAGKSVAGDASVWVGDVELCGGTSLMTFSSEAYAGQPAVIEKQTGCGSAVTVVAATLNDALLGSLFEYILNKSGIPYRRGVPEHVEIIQRGKVLFAINHSREPVRIPLTGIQKMILGDGRPDEIWLKPYGVVICKMV